MPIRHFSPSSPRLFFSGLLILGTMAAWACAQSGNDSPAVQDNDAGSPPASDGGGTSSGSGGSSSGGGGSGGGSSGAGSSSGASSSGGSGGGAEGGMLACDVTSTGGLPLSGTLQNYLTSPADASPSYGGFAYALSDSTAEGCGAGADAKACGTSVGCLAKGEFCGAGTTGVKNGAITYGAGIGANLSQSTDGGTGAGVTVSATGLTYAVSSVPTNSLEIEIKDGTTEYCYVTTVASGTVPWASFVEKCTSSTVGAAFAGTTITGVSFEAKAGATTATYDFCVTDLSL
jgi:hypothetical protein